VGKPNRATSLEEKILTLVPGAALGGKLTSMELCTGKRAVIVKGIQERENNNLGFLDVVNTNSREYDKIFFLTIGFN
jgi:hypothetical protein